MSVLYSRIQVVRDTISSITQILSGKDIPVYQRGIQAHVAYDAKTGEAKSVTLPYLPDDSSEELITAVQGFLDHEVGHILFTDSKEIVKISHDPELLEFQNIIEDPFVERKMRERFAGSKDNMTNLHTFFIDKLIKPRYEKMKEDGETNPLAYLGTLLPCLVRHWSGIDQFTDFLHDKHDDVAPIIDKLNKLYPDFIETIGKTESTAENVDLARQLLDAIVYVPEDDYSDDGDEGEGESRTLSSPSECASGSPKPRGSGMGTSDTPPSTCEIDEEGGDEPHDESKGGDGSDSAAKGGDGSDEESGDGDSFEKSHLLDEELDEEGKDEPETEKTGSASEEEEGESETEKTGSASEEEEGESETEKTGSASEEEEEEEVYVPDEGEKFSDHSVGDLDDCLTDLIKDKAKAVHSESEYLIYSTDEDIIEPVEERKSAGVEGTLKKMDEEVSDMVSGIVSDFERAFVSKNISYWRNNQNKGRINPSSLAKLSVGDLRVFRKKVEHTTQDYDVSLVIDCSGSMASGAGDGKTRMDVAIEAAYAMGMALDRVGINFEIIGFTSKGTQSIDDDYELTHKLGRVDRIYMPVFKSFSERWSPEIWRRLASFKHSPHMEQNVDGESILIAGKRLAAEKSTGKAMIVLSDGSPCCNSPDSRALQKHLIKTVRDLENIGFKMVGIGINTTSVNTYYSNSIVLRDLKELATTVVSEVRRIILG